MVIFIYKIVDCSDNFASARLKLISGAALEASLWLLFVTPLDAAAAENARKAGAVGLVHPRVNERVVAGG